MLAGRSRSSRWSAAASPCAGRGGLRRRLAATTAHQQQPFPSSVSSPSAPPPSEHHLRVLRYPNGDERVIRYPAYAPAAAELSATAATTATATATLRRANANGNAAPAASSCDSGSDGGGGSSSSSSSSSSVQPATTLDDYLSWDVTGLWSMSSARPQAPGQADATKQQGRSPPPPPPPAASSPEQQRQQEQEEEQKEADQAAAATSSGRAAAAADADYLESLFAAAYAQRPLAPKGASSRPAAAAAAAADPLPAGTYQVLEGCPWPFPRPLYTLALRHSASAAAAALAARLRHARDEGGGDAGEDDEQDDEEQDEEDRVGSTYTLSVRSRDRGAASDLARALGKGADWAARMDVGARRDGVVAFGSERDARRYALLLESPLEAGGGHTGVAVARVDSHALFRAIADVKSVVVFLPPAAPGAGPPRPHQLAQELQVERG